MIRPLSASVAVRVTLANSRSYRAGRPAAVWLQPGAARFGIKTRCRRLAPRGAPVRSQVWFNIFGADAGPGSSKVRDCARVQVFAECPLRHPLAQVAHRRGEISTNRWRPAGRCRKGKSVSLQWLSATWPVHPAPSSPTSSKNNMPPSAAQHNLHALSRAGKRPLTWPNSADIMCRRAGVAQFTSTNGPLSWWQAGF